MIEGIFCGYWEIFLKDNTLDFAFLEFNVDYSDGEDEPDNGLSVRFKDGKISEKKIALPYIEDKDTIKKVESLLTKKLNETNKIKVLEKAVSYLSMLNDSIKISEEKISIPSYNNRAKEYWFKVEGILAKFMLLYGNSGYVINFRMIFDEFPEDHVLIKGAYSFLNHCMRHSKDRLHFLMQKK